MSIFRKRKLLIEDFSALAVDFHNHVLPGIDDGSPSKEESLKMLRKWVELGFKKIIASPHVISALYPNTKDVILGQMHHMREVILENDIPLEFEATAEYHLDFEFNERLERGELIPFGKKNFILVELPFQRPSYPVEEMIFSLQLAGFEPILAHPERYTYLYSNFSEYQKMKDRGLLFQLNMNSLSGMYNLAVKKAAEKLIKNNMIEFACSDAHHAIHLHDLMKLRINKHFVDLLESGSLRNHELL